MTKYTKATLHANGETQDFSTPEDAKRLRAAFRACYFKSSDGTLEYGITSDASTFVVLTIDQTAVVLAPKPNCDNYGECTTTAVKGGDITVRYVDTADTTTDLEPQIIITGNVGDPYTTVQQVITGYTFSQVVGAASGTFTDQPQSVTYEYTKDQE